MPRWPSFFYLSKDRKNQAGPVFLSFSWKKGRFKKASWYFPRYILGIFGFNYMKALLDKIAGIFVGSGIGQKLPLLHSAYKRLYSFFSKGSSFFLIPLGLRFEAPTDSGVSLFLSAKKSYEPLETSILISTLRKGDFFFDIGAHTGYYSLIAGKIVGRRGKVFAFEPEKNNISFLEDNIKRNGLKNVEVVDKAVSDRNGEVKFYRSLDSSGDHSLVRNTGVFEKVGSVSLDSFCASRRAYPNVLKVDVEGAELLVLRGARRVLKNKSLRDVFIEISNVSVGLKIAKLLRDSGFELFVINENGFSLSEFKISDFRNLVKEHGYINILAKR